jgi:hypothetical protein
MALFLLLDNQSNLMQPVTVLHLLKRVVAAVNCPEPIFLVNKEFHYYQILVIFVAVF